MLSAIAQWAKRGEVPVPLVNDEPPGSMLSTQLSTWAALCAPEPMIVLFDEVDVRDLRDYLVHSKDGVIHLGVSENDYGRQTK